MSQSAMIEDSVIVNISKIDPSIWLVKSCFDDGYRLKKPNTSRFTPQYIYADQQYFAEDGCFTLHTRKRPDIEDVKGHILEITTIKEAQIFINIFEE